MTLELRYADGQLAALARLKLAFPAATHPTVQDSATLQSQETKPVSQTAQERMQAPSNPYDLSQLFDVHEQGKTRIEPRRKLSVEMCTSCRREKHYGPCSAPKKIPTKAADFNPGLTADDPSQGDNPSTSANYHAATTADSSLARARDGRPADEQAGTYFADLFRHLGIQSAADEPGRMTGGLNKVAIMFPPAPRMGGGVMGALGGVAGAALIPYMMTRNMDPRTRGHALIGGMLGGMVGRRFMPGLAGGLGGSVLGTMLSSKFGDWQLWGTDGHSTHEQRGPGPTSNPYEERLTVKSPPIGWGDEGEQRIRRAFDQIDGAVDSTSIEDASKGQPDSGPAVLG